MEAALNRRCCLFSYTWNAIHIAHSELKVDNRFCAQWTVNNLNRVDIFNTKYAPAIVKAPTLSIAFRWKMHYHPTVAYVQLRIIVDNKQVTLNQRQICAGHHQRSKSVSFTQRDKLHYHTTMEAALPSNDKKIDVAVYFRIRGTRFILRTL
nr:hypothetical protein [Tanacetum cinerariifolium]